MEQDSGSSSTVSAPTLTTWWLYLLACADGRTYAGIAIDPHARFNVHRSGKGAKFTRSNPPLRILGAQAFTDRRAALRAEIALKQLDKLAKLRWALQHSIKETEHSEHLAPTRRPRRSRQKT